MKAPSCLIVKLLDVSYMDVSANIHDAVKINISGIPANELGYLLTSKMPTEEYLVSRTFDVSAVINVGWCKTENSLDWLKKGDYLSQHTNEVMIKSKQVNYIKHIDVNCFGK